MFLVQANTISHLEVRTLSLWGLEIPKQTSANCALVLVCHIFGRHPNAAMVAGIVPFDQRGKQLVKTKGVGRGEIAKHASFQGAVRGKMMNVLLFQKRLKRVVVEFFAQIRLQLNGFPLGFQKGVKGFHHRHPGLGFERLHPRVLGQYINHRQQVTHPLVELRQPLHFHQIRHPLMVDAFGLHFQCRKPLPTRFVQGVAQFVLKQMFGTPTKMTCAATNRATPPKLPGGCRILAVGQQGWRRRHRFLGGGGGVWGPWFSVKGSGSNEDRAGMSGQGRVAETSPFKPIGQKGCFFNQSTKGMKRNSFWSISHASNTCKGSASSVRMGPCPSGLYKDAQSHWMGLHRSHFHNTVNRQADKVVIFFFFLITNVYNLFYSV